MARQGINKAQNVQSPYHEKLNRIGENSFSPNSEVLPKNWTQK